ncbi:CoA transferase [Pseudonocardia xishanensis]|uniref:CoA transferase n=1 Tax=Pseudonocardia xishanensis TaxID=630995 RepID=A0ABP8RTM7_9PSEU
MAETSATRPGPLAGVRVLDLTAMLAGPYATMLLADLGADVVKIEPPAGDTTRIVGPLRPGDDPEKALGGYFQSVNRGKGSVVLDLKTEEGKGRLIELVRAADVLVENYSAGVMERLGLDYEVLAAENPRLVYGALRGFGDHRSGASPYERWPALDVVAQAMGGFLSITGTEDGAPVKSGPGIGDIFPGALLALGIVSAVRHAERTGEGQFVDVAMYDAVLALCERMVYQHSMLGIVPRPEGNKHPLLSPFDILPTADGWIAVAAPQERLWHALVRTIGRPELAEDERFAGNATRARRSEEVRALIGPWFLERTTAEAVQALGGVVPVGPVNDAAAVFADPHVAAREMLVDVEQPGSAEPVTIVGSPMKLSRTPSSVRGRGPALGEDDVDVVLGRWGR